MQLSLESCIKNYDDEKKSKYSEVKQFDDGNFIIVIVTPLIIRILDYLRETEEVLFSDSTDNVDTYGCKLYMFLSNSCCGGLPVRCIITTSECEDSFYSGLEIYKTFLNYKSFGL